MLSAIGIFLFGVIMIPLLGVDFGSILPVDHVGDITGIHDGLEAFWLPWWCFLLAGEVFIIFLTLRLIEYRGNGEQVASKTTFVRRFGIPAFSVYSWHRFWVAPLVMLLTWIFGQPSWLGGSITGASLNWWQTIITLVLVQLMCGLILIGWEKIGYVGGIEWMMAEVSALFGPNMRKTKGTTKTHAKWWEYGKMDVDALFYRPHWIDIIKRDEHYVADISDSKFALKLSIPGLFTGFLAFFAFIIALNARRTEGPNSYNRKALVISTFGILLVIAFLVVTSFLTLDQFGISL
jgi:hypothetical protein